MAFNLLDISRSWDDYWSEHPNGYSPQEQMINWLSQLNAMIDWINQYFDVDLSGYTEDILNSWYDSGRLATIINEAVFNGKADKSELQTVASKLNNFKTINVRDFGAVGDGVTDDTAAIKAAIAAIPVADNAGRNGGGKLLFPAGVYLITETLTISNHNVMMTGDSSGVSEIKAGSPFIGTEMINWNRGAWHFIKDNAMEHLWIDAGGNEIGGVVIRSWYDNCHISNVNIRGFKNSIGLVIEPEPGGGVTMCQGIVLDTVEINPFQLNNKPVAKLSNLFESSIINCKFWNTSAPGVKNNADVVHILGCRGLVVLGGSAAAGAIGYLISNAADTAPFRTNNYVTMIGQTIEGLDVGIKVDGASGLSQTYTRITGVRPLTTTKHVVVDYAIGTAIDMSGLGPVDVMANAASTHLYGQMTGGPISDLGTKTVHDYYMPGTMVRRLPDRIQGLNSAGVAVFDLGPTVSHLASPLSLNNQTTSTSATGGAATAPPAQPVGYITVKINGTDRKIPYYT